QLFIGRRIMGQIVDCGLLCVVVTFLDELAALGPAIASMVSTVDPADDTRRTFEIVRRPSDGLAYALAIAEKHRLTYPSLKARLVR
ncbi:MAG: MutS-related protein, partial [Candidatus Limnocylindrales bacterium]